jgi:uncharacterized protein YndB with AHSA1/START domain
MSIQEPLARSVAHATFTIERSFPASPARVFSAFADKAARRRWYVGGEGWEVFEHEAEFRNGGFEVSRFSYQGGPEIRNDTVFHDIVENERIVLSYAMAMSGQPPFSASLLTIELIPEAGGTRLRQTEQGAYFDGHDGSGRKEGLMSLLEALARELERN